MPTHHLAVTWREILTREYAAKIITLCMAVWLHAANSMLTATTMPSAVEEIGGLNLISWTFALYLMGSICAGASASLLVQKRGLRTTMIRAALLYTLGCGVCALAPNMPVVLIGRILQGLGGGGLVALVYISQDRFFPNRFVPKIVACISVVWMLSSFCGPVIGGAFATWGLWRYAYWAFALQALLLALAIRYLLRHEAKPEMGNPTARIPFVRLSFLATAILLVSMASADFDPVTSPLMVLLGCVALCFFVLRDKKATVGRMLPSNVTDLSQALGNGILTTLLLCLCIMSFLVYGPLILIKLYALTPLTAGFIVMLESIAWGCASIIFSGTRAENEPRLIRVGSSMVVFGLMGMSIALPHGPVWAIIGALIIGNSGFGMMWGFIIKRIIGAASTDDKDRTSSAIPITQQVGFALGAALSGLLANGLGFSESSSAQAVSVIAFWLFAGFVPVALIANGIAWRFTR